MAAVGPEKVNRNILLTQVRVLGSIAVAARLSRFVVDLNHSALWVVFDGFIVVDPLKNADVTVSRCGHVDRRQLIAKLHKTDRVVRHHEIRWENRTDTFDVFHRVVRVGNQNVRIRKHFVGCAANDVSVANLFAASWDEFSESRGFENALQEWTSVDGGR